MNISIIVAAAENGVIGRNDGTIPWRIRTDMQHFKRLTTGHPLIMGRKTYETLGKPLPGRTNIVVTRDRSYVAEGCVVVNGAKDALRAAEQTGAAEAFVGGGAIIYQELLPTASIIYLTRVHASPEGDAYFAYDESEWEEVSVEPHPAQGDEDQYPFTFISLKRR